MSLLSWFSARPRKFGYLPDEPDHRDRYLAELLLGTIDLPRRVSLTDQYTFSARNQGATNACVGFAVSTALRAALEIDRKKRPELSAFFVYYLARKEHDFSPILLDGGTYLRAALKAVIRFGAAEERLHPASAGTSRAPSWRALRDAYDYRGLRGYYRIPAGDVQGVRQALASGRPVVAGFLVGQSFLDNDGPTRIVQQSAPFAGGHAVVVSGYDGDDFEIVNSWGASWRNGGRAKISEAFMGAGTDLWAIDT
jgi:hypothetical protein